MDNILEIEDFAEVKLPNNKKILKEFLLKEHKIIITKKVSLFKGGEVILRHKFISFGFAVILLATMISAAFLTRMPIQPFLTPKVEAQEAIKRAFDRFVKLSDKEKEFLQKKLKADLRQSLLEAKNAKDLELVPEDQIQRIEMPKMRDGSEDVFMLKPVDVREVEGKPEWTAANEVDKSQEMAPGTRVQFVDSKIMAPRGIKILRYTNPQGQEVILGIDENDEPVMKLIKIDREMLEKGELNQAKDIDYKFDISK